MSDMVFLMGFSVIAKIVCQHMAIYLTLADTLRTILLMEFSEVVKIDRQGIVDGI